MGQQVCCYDLEREEESDLTKENEWEPMDWEIREWYTELRENDITMHELNIKRSIQIKKAQEAQETEERRRREQEIIDRENELAARQRELEAKELELEEKAALLEIAIRVNELSIETRFGGLERRLEELQIASKLRRTQNMEVKRGSIDRINNLWDDESSSDSEDSS
jgi:hypothetical protein